MIRSDFPLWTRWVHQRNPQRGVYCIYRVMVPTPGSLLIGGAGCRRRRSESQRFSDSWSGAAGAQRRLLPRKSTSFRRSERRLPNPRDLSSCQTITHQCARLTRVKSELVSSIGDGDRRLAKTCQLVPARVPSTASVDPHNMSVPRGVGARLSVECGGLPPLSRPRKSSRHAPGSDSSDNPPQAVDQGEVGRDRRVRSSRYEPPRARGGGRLNALTEDCSAGLFTFVAGQVIMSGGSK